MSGRLRVGLEESKQRMSNLRMLGACLKYVGREKEVFFFFSFLVILSFIKVSGTKFNSIMNKYLL